MKNTLSPRYVYFLSKVDPLEFNKRKDYYECILATDEYFSYMYAKDVLKGRFEKGEKVIATDSQYSFQYAENVIKGRFELGEYSISAIDIIAYAYCVKYDTSFLYKLI